jgi:CheY-like chemotaxis protein
MTDLVSNILLVDDDKFLLDMYSMKFVQHGHTVQACLSAHDALDCLQKGFKADVILFDLIMPEMDGFAFLEKLQSEKIAEHAMKFALTNQSTDAEQKRVLDLGAEGFFVKATMIPSEVVNTVEATLRKRAGA